ncbi:hypothetical protein CT0861_06521 [Colletotrichum tofieldiae]|uniref:Uncharacterized protein n=1 Tax=Colletotrichum tofieldiae TaxID=708197 RepID=A0A166TZ19_9PEZI|nr:hypothetical protein CT0861_06521 [Colletotrichum tofieldiae]GKT94372.1 hypothetical protein Ct61P_12222 [Colletotrichum tofieldiae]
METCTILDKPPYRRLFEEKGLAKMASKTDGDSSWSLDWLATNPQYAPMKPNKQETAESRLARDLRKSSITIRKWRLVSMVLITALIASWLLILLRPTSRADYPQPEEGTDNVLKWMKEAEVAEGHFWCGTSIMEAKQRGCTFDKLHNRWMSPACTPDFEYAKKAVFDALGGTPDFRFYRDDDGKPGDEIFGDDLDELEILTPAWTTVGHHMTHCMYLLLQAAASLNLGTKADMVVHAWEHAKHCATVILNETQRSPGWNDVASFGHTQSGVCW